MSRKLIRMIGMAILGAATLIGGAGCKDDAEDAIDSIKDAGEEVGDEIKDLVN